MIPKHPLLLSVAAVGWLATMGQADDLEQARLRRLEEETATLSALRAELVEAKQTKDVQVIAAKEKAIVDAVQIISALKAALGDKPVATETASTGTPGADKAQVSDVPWWDVYRRRPDNRGK